MNNFELIFPALASQNSLTTRPELWVGRRDEILGARGATRPARLSKYAGLWEVLCVQVLRTAAVHRTALEFGHFW